MPPEVLRFTNFVYKEKCGAFTQNERKFKK